VSKGSSDGSLISSQLPVTSNSQLSNSTKFNQKEDEICFIRAQNCCVCFVDIIDSTRITSDIDNPEKIRKYYEIFLNTMAAIARSLRAKIIKNVGDCLIFCYPETSDPSNKAAFNDVLECCITMIDARDTMNQKLHEEELPSISYRISADYGRVEVAKSATSQSDDLFGPIMNICSKINSKALPSGAVIGDGLYRLIQSFSLPPSFEKNHYHLEKVAASELQQTEFNDYPLYHLQKNNDINCSNDVEIQKQVKSSINILLVDDEQDILYTFKACLASEGYNVETFVDPMEALAHFAKLRPSYYNLAILDIRMPGLSGLQLYYRLKAINRYIKILFVSALDAVPELTSLISLLPDMNTTNGIIKKPVELGNFVSTVRKTLA
jgi:two-component system, OmpR family, response regulator ChvI